MAAVRDTCQFEELFVCPVCLENFIEPRYLTTCLHSFCDQCLWTFVTDWRDKDPHATMFDCPVCRKPHSLATCNGNAFKYWFQKTFPPDDTAMSMMERHAKDRVTVTKRLESAECTTCKAQGHAVGIQFCLNCQKYLCELCIGCHKTHKVVDRDEYLLDSDDAACMQRFNKCDVHPEYDAVFYCETDKAFFCDACSAIRHRSCGKVLDINKVRYEESVNEIRALIRDMKQARSRMPSIEASKDARKNAAISTLQDAVENAKQLQIETAQLMDKMVNHVTTLAKQLTLQTESETIHKVNELKDIDRRCGHRIKVLEAAAKHGSRKHVFISSKRIKEEFDTIKESVHSHGQLETIDYKLVMSEALSDLLEVRNATHLATIEGVEKNVQVAGGNDSLRPSALARVEMHTVNLSANPECAPTFSGIDAFSGGKLMLCDSCSDTCCGFFCIYSPEDNELVAKLKMNKPIKVTTLDDNRAAVITKTERAIYVVGYDAETNKLKINKKLKTKNRPKALVSLGDSELAVCWTKPTAFGIVNIGGNDIEMKVYFEKDTEGRPFKSFSHLAIDKDKSHVVQPCIEDKAVYCFQFLGNPVFRYSHDELVQPEGVAVGSGGNVYICENYNSSIHIVSPLGEGLVVIKDGMPDCPLAICQDDSLTGEARGFWITQYVPPYNKVYFIQVA